MDGNEYQVLALRTAQLDTIGNARTIINCSLGLSGESGEFADHLKKFMFQGHEFDTLHQAKELGDILWYVAVCAKAMGYTLEDIMQMNVEKLEERYPMGFTADASLNRK